jgi:hypothetical protein
MLTGCKKDIADLKKQKEEVPAELETLKKTNSTIEEKIATPPAPADSDSGLAFMMRRFLLV